MLYRCFNDMIINLFLDDVRGMNAILVDDITQHTHGFSDDVMTCAGPYQVVNYGLGGVYGLHEDSVRVSRRQGVFIVFTCFIYVCMV